MPTSLEDGRSYEILEVLIEHVGPLQASLSGNNSCAVATLSHFVRPALLCEDIGLAVRSPLIPA